MPVGHAARILKACQHWLMPKSAWPQEVPPMSLTWQASSVVNPDSPLDYHKEECIMSTANTLNPIAQERMLTRRAFGALAAATAFVGRFGGSAAQSGSPDASYAAAGPMPAHRFRLGDLDLRVLDAGAFMAPASLPVTNAPPLALAAALAKANLSADGYPLPIHPLLIETGGQRVLIDTGVGAITAFGATDTLPAALAAEGIAPEEIDVVLFTHLHFDHASGAIDAAGKPAFPNAQYLVGQTEYEFWWGEPSLIELAIPDDVRRLLSATAKAPLAALRGKIEQIAPGDEVAPGITVIEAPGHTPGHLAVEVTSGGEGLIHVGDAASQPVLHLEHPDWFAASDNWPAQSMLTRRALLDRAAKENLLVMTYHFPFPGLGHVTIDGDDWGWQPAV
jgi:glyoxylase-like metal-dependent hydrolase (beta-lactamase superfamily II)